MVKAVTPIPFVKARFFDRCGKPLAGGKVYTYEANTTTAKTTYKDPYGLTPNTNPIILDAAGEADIYLDGTYRIRITDRNDVLVNDVSKIGAWFSDNLQDTLDNISGAMDDAIKPALQSLDDAINTAAAAGAGANGWTDQLILLSNGRTQRQKNSDLVTPFDFGAIGDGKHHPVSEWTNIGSQPYFPNLEAIQVKFPHVTSLTDSIDWCAIQAFFDYCKTNVVKDANISGNFSVNKELNFVQGHGALTKTFTGFMRLTATANMHHVIRIAGSFLNMDAFYLRKSSSSLKIPYGLFMGGYLDSDSTICSQIKSIDAQGFDMVSVNLDQNTMFCKLGVLRGNGGKVSSFTFSNPVQSGSENSQRTTLTVSYVPEYRNSIPKLHAKDFQAPNTFVYINNRAHRVEAIDKELGTITIYPALFGVTEGTGKCIEGAFYHHGGNNAGCVEVGTLSALGGGTGVSEVALYTGTYANIITENCGIGLVLGANGGDPAMQFNVDRIYFEVNTIDFIQSGARWPDGRTALRSAMGLNENKIFALSALDYLETNGKYASTNTSGRLGAGDYCIRDKVYTSDYGIVKHWSATNSLSIELGGESGIKQGVMGTSQFDINVTVNSKLVELFGRSEMGVHIKHPTNSSLAPTGIVRVTLPTGWKINGVDSNTISYTGFYKAPTLFISVFNAESKLALISIDGLTSDLISTQTVKKGTTAGRPSTPYIGQSYLDTTLLASGKPIFWNGTAWVDALGVTA